MKVFWKVGDVYTEMIQVDIFEIRKARLRLPHMVGIPHVYAFYRGEVYWWPQCLHGEPFVKMDDGEANPLSGVPAHPLTP